MRIGGQALETFRLQSRRLSANAGLGSDTLFATAPMIARAAWMRSVSR
jgi:hypothetical protein